MNPNLNRLQPYPFEKLQQIKAGIQPPADKSPIIMSIGEPKHDAPAFALDCLKNSLGEIGKYPATRGIDELRQSIAAWASQRFNLKPDTLTASAHILPVSGTREALFAFTQAIVDSSQADTKVLMPNPFYQIYEGACLLAGAQPWFINCLAENNYEPDFKQIDETTWQQCQLLFICSPGNPTGTILSQQTLQELILLADKYDFVIASDECYSELYFDENTPPTGILQACAAMNRNDYRRCVAFHSLSKRSNLPGLRSGFVAGDADIIQRFLLYRTYHGCALPLFTQRASIAAWNDEQHVRENRTLYRKKFDDVLAILDGSLALDYPQASFYLWPKTPVNDIEFTQQLFAQENITVLPGSFLARDFNGHNPGENHVRMALVASYEECVEAAKRIKQFMQRNQYSTHSY